MKLYLATVLEFTYDETLERYAHNCICATADEAQAFISAKVSELKAEYDDIFEVPYGNENLNCGNRYSTAITPQEVAGVVPEAELLQEKCEHLQDLISSAYIDEDVAEVYVKWKDTGDEDRRIIALGSMDELGIEEGGLQDDLIFFYADGIDGLLELCDPSCGEDFYVVAFEKFNDLWNF